jgi:uncharacterized protein (DUF1330 family)
MIKKTKRIIIPLIFLVLLAAAYGYYLYNKGPLSVVNSTAIKMSAEDLYQLFSTDPGNAIKKYAGKVIAVSGTVESLSTNQQKQMIVLIKTNANGGFINCTMEETDAQIRKNMQVTIKGICSGIGQGDEDLGISGDVYLSRCYVIN